MLIKILGGVVLYIAAVLILVRLIFGINEGDE